ncbi:hypothetical protein [Kitasatospora sp. LaBMicrA B282]|uniref:hypothetical protein n=1 Tax=Kitasatospora sp. LaBMicrA B282 TaxID=3420949 RepID=UPI003D0D19CC
MASQLDTQQLALCPGVGRFVRGARRVSGTARGEQATMEWQWAQWAMFGYFYLDFKDRYPNWSFVLAEDEYTELATGLTAADDMLARMREEFRRDYAGGGEMRPDILGFCARPPQGPQLVLELLEVTSRAQAAKTFREDIDYRLYKFEQIIKGVDPAIRKSFSLTSYTVAAGASKWRPRAPLQRVVPLPERTEDGTTYLEWICFEPTFWYPWPDGTDGLLLYEIHSIPVKSELVPAGVRKRLADEERRRRAASRTAYGVTLTPWLTEDYLNRNHDDRDALRAIAAVAGAGLLVALAVYLTPAVAGLELTALLQPAAAGTAALTDVGAGTLTGLASGLSATLATGAQWMAALGRPLVNAAGPGG